MKEKILNKKTVFTIITIILIYYSINKYMKRNKINDKIGEILKNPEITNLIFKFIKDNQRDLKFHEDKHFLNNLMQILKNYHSFKKDIENLFNNKIGG